MHGRRRRPPVRPVRPSQAPGTIGPGAGTRAPGWSGPYRPRATGASHLSTVDTSASEALARVAADAASDKGASDIRVLDLGELLGITDFFVIVSASNDRQLRAVVEEVERRAKDSLSRGPRRREGSADTGWSLLDYGDVVVHAFTQEQRRFYDLERLWSDAPVLPYEPPVPAAAPRPDASA